jgi:transposase
MSDKYPWRSKDWLHDQYIVQGKGMSQIAKQEDTSPATIHDWIGRHGIEARRKELPENHAINMESKLRELHHDKEWNVNQIAKEFDVSRDAVKNRLNRFDIERQHYAAERCGHGAFFYTTKKGYEKCGASNSLESTTVRFHKLHACLNHHPHKVFQPDASIHHKNRVPWDNRIENLELLTNQEHSILHSEAGDLHNLDEEGYND